MKVSNKLMFIFRCKTRGLFRKCIFNVFFDLALSFDINHSLKTQGEPESYLLKFAIKINALNWLQNFAD